MWSIYSLCPAPWGDQYRFVEAFDIEEDAKEVLVALEKVNILSHCYKLVEEVGVYANIKMRRENVTLKREVEELQSLISAMKEGR